MRLDMFGYTFSLLVYRTNKCIQNRATALNVWETRILKSVLEVTLMHRVRKHLRFAITRYVFLFAASQQHKTAFKYRIQNRIYEHIQALDNKENNCEWTSFNYS